MARNYCFTINYKWMEDDDGNIIDRFEDQTVPYPEEWKDLRYVVWQEEIGENGTHHIQGFVQFNRTKRLGELKKLPGLERAHLERMKGTASEARAYCMKEDSTTVKDTLFELGTFSAGQGSRMDLTKLRDKVKAGATLKELFDDDETLRPALQYNRGLHDMISAYNAEQKRNFKTEVHVYYGRTGTGKTRKAYEEHPDLYMKPHSKWWDSYSGEEVVLLDDFYGWYPYHQLLILLDRYGCPVEYKGGYKQIAPKKIIITSNKTPVEWYADSVVSDLAPLYRRIDKFVHFVDGEQKEFVGSDLDAHGVPIWYRDFQRSVLPRNGRQ